MKKYLPVILSSILSVAIFVLMLFNSPIINVGAYAIVQDGSALSFAGCLFCIFILLVGSGITVMQLWAEIQLESDEAQRLADENAELKKMRDQILTLQEDVRSLSIKQQMNGFGG